MLTTEALKFKKKKRGRKKGKRPIILSKGNRVWGRGSCPLGIRFLGLSEFLGVRCVGVSELVNTSVNKCVSEQRQRRLHAKEVLLVTDLFNTKFQCHT